jgi:hypothetical protein
VALHPVLHVYVHCVLYENENSDASSKVSSFINVSYDRQFRTTPVLERSNFVDVMEVRTFFLHVVSLCERFCRGFRLICDTVSRIWLSSK